MSWIDYGLGGLRSETLDLLDAVDDLSDLYRGLLGGASCSDSSRQALLRHWDRLSLAETGEFLAGLGGPGGTRRAP